MLQLIPVGSPSVGQTGDSWCGLGNSFAFALALEDLVCFLTAYPATYFIRSVSTSTVTSVSQVSLSEDYLECVAKQQETLRPFGDVPRDMKAKVIRAFVTARSFVQGLLVSADVVRKVSQVSVHACNTHLGVGILPLWGRNGKSPWGI